MQKFKFSFDKNQDDLFLYRSESKSKGSVEIGDIILDLNNKKEIVGLQIMKASNMLDDVSVRISLNEIKDVLKNLKECKVEIILKKNLVIIRIHLYGKMKEFSSTFFFPKFMDSSPALAYS